MDNGTEELRGAMIRFERKAIEQARLADRDGMEAKWVGSALRLATRLCCALRAAIPGDSK